jgi:hypothetical protein
MGFVSLALLMAQPAQARGRAQLSEFCLLAAGDDQGPLDVGFGLGCTAEMTGKN